MKFQENKPYHQEAIFLPLIIFFNRKSNKCLALKLSCYCNHTTITIWRYSNFLEANCNASILIRKCLVMTVRDFLIKLGIKPVMHLLEISIFSLNNDLVRLTKIMNNLVKDLKILSFKVIFQYLKLVESFQKKFCEKYLIYF